jgi:hypothetical protein
MIRAGTRDRLRKLMKATEMVEPIYSEALCSGKRTRHHWATVMEVLREKKDQLEMIIRMYRVSRKKKSEEVMKS